MDWNKLSRTTLVLKNYDLLRKTGVLNYIEELKLQIEDLELLLHEACEIFRQETAEQIINLITRYLSEKFIPSRMIFILNEGIMMNKIKTIAYENMKSVEPPRALVYVKSLKPFEGFFKRYAKTTNFIVLNDKIRDSEYLRPFQKINSQLVVPIMGISGLYGIILFGAKVLGENYSEEEISYIDKLMQFASIGFQNTIHYDLSIKDSKTNLYNHNFFIHSLKEQLARAKRKKRPCSILILDIDHFKAFNDTYGHLAGDEVILKLAQTLQRTVRKGEILSRFGGEEFTLLLPQTNRKGVMQAAERLRKRIEKMKIPYQNQVLKITISLGAACYNSQRGVDEKILIKQADKALYQSKTRGRNCSTLYVPSLLRKGMEIMQLKRAEKKTENYGENITFSNCTG